MADINLIPADERSNSRSEAAQKKLQAAAIGLLAITGVLTVLTLLLFTMSSSTRSQLESDVSEATAKINKLKAQEELIVVVKDKAAAANSLIAARVDFSAFFNKLSALIPQGIYFTDIRFVGEKMVISGKARSSSEVAGLVNSLTSASGTSLVSDIAVDSLSSDETGQYVFVMSARLVGAQPPEELRPPGAPVLEEEPL